MGLGVQSMQRGLGRQARQGNLKLCFLMTIQGNSRDEVFSLRSLGVFSFLFGTGIDMSEQGFH